uniref:Expressed protein n=1 Tax=Echinococcus granulosus TaxID=6210 RepID=A0A068WNY9_ECHGR|nr:expressed protein [Echinococcus granulosus]
MFPGSDKFGRPDKKPLEPGPLNRAHTLLVRSLWQQLQAAFPEGFESLTSVDVGFRCKLRKEDILLIKRFVEKNPEFPIPSADSVNEIFSRFIEPIPEENEAFSLQIPFEYAFAFSPFLIYLVYRKVGAIITTAMAIFFFGGYEVYIKAIAKRHALISRLPSVPDHCLPYSKQSFVSRFFSWKSSRSSEDECIEYFKLTMTPPYAELRPDRIFLLVVGDFVETISSTAGASLGQFYYVLNSWVPFYAALPLAFLFIWLLIRVASSPRKLKTSKNKRISKHKEALPLKQK